MSAAPPPAATPARMAERRIDETAPPGKIGNLADDLALRDRATRAMIAGAVARPAASPPARRSPSPTASGGSSTAASPPAAAISAASSTICSLMVVVLAIATACRFYFVSMLGERVVADVRAAVHDNLLRLEPRFFEENRPSEIASRLTADTAVIEMVVGTTVSVALRNIVHGHRRHHLSVHAGAEADRRCCCSASRSSSCRSSSSAAGCATSRAAARTGSPMSARSSPRRSGAMKIVQALRPGGARERAASATRSSRLRRPRGGGSRSAR